MNSDLNMEIGAERRRRNFELIEISNNSKFQIWSDEEIDNEEIKLQESPRNGEDNLKMIKNDPLGKKVHEALEKKGYAGIWY